MKIVLEKEEYIKFQSVALYESTIADLRDTVNKVSEQLNADGIKLFEGIFRKYDETLAASQDGKLIIIPND